MTPTPEDRLRATLRDEVDDVWPAGSFTEVQRRRRRMDRRARIARSAMAVVALVALIGGALAVANREDPERRVVTDPTTTTTTTTTTTVPAPHLDEPGIWPFTSAAQARKGPGTGATFDTTDATRTAMAFLRTVAGPDWFERGELTADGDRATVAITNRVGRPTTVRLSRLGGSEHWTVTSLESADVVIEEPGAGAEVGNPVRVAGRASAFEGTVQLAVLERVAGFERPRQLGDGFATGEQGELLPFADEVALDDVPEHGAITVLAFTTSAEDGSIDRISAVPARVVAR